VADKSVQSRLSFSPAPSLARKEGQKIFSKEIGRRDLIQAIIGIILSRIKEDVSAVFYNLIDGLQQDLLVHIP